MEGVSRTSEKEGFGGGEQDSSGLGKAAIRTCFRVCGISGLGERAASTLTRQDRKELREGLSRVEGAG